MLEQFTYTNNLNEKLEFGKDCLFVNENDLRDFAWEITSKNNIISGFKKGIVQKTLPIIINCNSEAEGISLRNRLFEVFERDVLEKKHGKIHIGEYYLRCYITGSKKTQYLIHKNIMFVSVTVHTDLPEWVKETTMTFKIGSVIVPDVPTEPDEPDVPPTTYIIQPGQYMDKGCDVDDDGAVYPRSFEDNYGNELFANTWLSRLTSAGVTLPCRIDLDASITCAEIYNAGYDGYQCDGITFETDGTICFNLEDDADTYAFPDGDDSDNVFIDIDESVYPNGIEVDENTYKAWNAVFEKLTYSLMRMRSVDETEYLDYPHDFPYDFKNTTISAEFNNESLTASNFIIRIYGEVTNPTFYIAEHKYAVNVTIGENEYLTIDSINKTIVLTEANGRQVNCFNNRDKTSYIFEKIPHGLNMITSETENLHFDLTLFAERSEPKWT